MFIIPRTTKTYFTVTQKDIKENKLYDFPPEFIQSKNKKYINVISCKLKYKDYLVGDVKVHASFIERDHYDDYFCIMANQSNSYVKRYEYKSQTQEFKIWFTNLDGDEITPDSFIIEMLLTY